MTSIGDMAAEAAQQLQDEMTEEIGRDGKVVNFGDDDDVMTQEKRRGPFSKLSFRWRESDKMILEQIKVGAETAFVEMFDTPITIIDGLYMAMRVPKYNTHGIAVTDEHGRFVWERDEHGNYIEDWSRLTGQDIEKALLDIANVRFVASKQVNTLLMEALYAKRVHTDKRDDTYVAMIDGTIDDKSARANREARQDNYHAFFRFWLWSQGNVFMRELENFQRVLERIRDRRIWNQD